MGTETYEATRPLTFDEVLKKRKLRAREKPAARSTINLSTVTLPKGAKASLTRVRGYKDTVQLKITIPQGSFGKRVFTLDNVPSEVPKTSKKSPSAFEKKLKKVRPDGVRPAYFPLSFIPQKVELKLSETSFPPFDFEYRREEEILDRPTNVFAPDDRYIYNDTNFPWCTIGRVDTPLGFCTGCTIGPRLLLTANHTIQWNDDNTAGWVRFRPAYYNGSNPFGEAWATRVIYWRKTTPADGLSNSETAFDYVVCVLDTRIGDYIGYPGYRTYSDSWNGGSYWQHLGYPSDLSGGERPAFHGNASISSVETQSTSGQDGYVLGHFNDVVSGHSGGPVWGWWDGEPWPRVVGSQSTEARTPSMDTSGDNEFGGGPALSSLISWARSNYS